MASAPTDSLDAFESHRRARCCRRLILLTLVFSQPFRRRIRFALVNAGVNGEVAVESCSDHPFGTYLSK